MSNPLPHPLQAQTPNIWLPLEPGLDLATFVSPQKSEIGDSRVRVLRIEPKVFEFRLLNASTPDQGKRLSVKNWVLRNGLVAAINASMYQEDRKTSISLMRTPTHTNNPRLSKDRTLLAFNPKEKSLPPVQIIDRDCQDLNQLRKKYRILVQSIRMVSCRGENVWKQQPRKWSTAAIGMDHQGRILFIHVRSPYTTHDLINNLLKLPIHLERAMYVEGGPEAQLYINSGKNQFEFLGSYSTGSHESDSNHIAWPIPNVIGIARIPKGRK